MTEVAQNQPPALPSFSIPARRPSQPQQQRITIPAANGATNRTSQFFGLDAFSPVNQNGSFEFDRVLRSGEVMKRSRRTKTWKRFYLVLRPNLLSLYKSRSEEKLLKQLHLADITAVNLLKDPKGRRTFMFGVFSPARNFHFQADSDAEARKWVEVIKREARIDEDEGEGGRHGAAEEVMFMGSPASAVPLQNAGIDAYLLSGDEGGRGGGERGWHPVDRGISSSPEPLDSGEVSEAGAYGSMASSGGGSFAGSRNHNHNIPSISKSLAEQLDLLDYSGPEYSDLSDTAAPSSRGAHTHHPDMSSSFSQQDFALGALPTGATGAGGELNVQAKQQAEISNDSPQPNSAPGATNDDEKVIYHGYLLCLRSKGGVRQWKKLWVVLRRRHLTFYKNEEEYSAQRLIPLSSILSAVEIDPVSRTKRHCMQVITEEQSYRFNAPSEEVLARWLGALKSQLAKKKEKQEKGEMKASGVEAKREIWF